MLKKLLAILLLSIPSFAQLSTVSATVIDGASQAVAYGTYRIEYIQPFLIGSGQIAKRSDNGAVVSPLVFSGTLDSTGTFSQANIVRNDFIIPAQSQWKFTICPASDSGCFTYTTSITTASPSLSSQLSAAANTISVTASSDSYKIIPRAYNSNEMIGMARGSMYYNVIESRLYKYNGTSWSALEGLDCSSFPGNDVGAQINNCIAALPSPGGIADASKFSGIYTGATNININNKTVYLRLGCVDISFASTQSIVIQSSSKIGVTFIGINNGCTILRSATNHNLFDVSNPLKISRFEIKDIDMEGGLNSIKAMAVNAFNNGVYDWTQADISITHSIINGFYSGGFSIGQSTYINRITDNKFTHNCGSLDIAYASYHIVTGNTFWYPCDVGGNEPQFRFIGGDYSLVLMNNFERDDSTNPTGHYQGADIEINADGTGGSSGYTEIAFNRHGTEGESGTRYKIRNYTSLNTGYTSDRIDIVHNQYICAGGTTSQKVIGLINPSFAMTIDDNFFSSCTTIVDDLVANTDISRGTSIIGDNNQYYPLGGSNPSNQTPVTVCTNGCRGFTKVGGFYNTAQFQANPLPRKYYATSLRNRFKGLTESPAACAPCTPTGWFLNNVTVDGLQTDPLGTTRALKITKSANAQANFGILIDNTNLTNHVVNKLWLKAGTLSMVMIGLYNQTLSKFTYLPPVYLDTDWKEYKFNNLGINTGDSYEILVYPGNYADTVTGTIFVWALQSNDEDTPYLPNFSGSMVSSNSGIRFENAIEAPAGIFIGQASSGNPGSNGTWIKGHFSGTASLDFANQAAIGCNDLTITVNGAATSDTVAIGIDNASVVNTNALFYGWVSAANTVTVRYCSLASGNPASGTFRVDVWKH